MAQPSSEFQNHRVVSAAARSDQARTWGRYQSARSAAVGRSPGKPLSPYGPSAMMQVGVGQVA